MVTLRRVEPERSRYLDQRAASFIVAMFGALVAMIGFSLLADLLLERMDPRSALYHSIYPYLRGDENGVGTPQAATVLVVLYLLFATGIYCGVMRFLRRRRSVELPTTSDSSPDQLSVITNAQHDQARYLIVAYFHQDWGIEGRDDAEVVAHFCAAESTAVRSATKRALEELCRDRPDEELGRLLNSWGCGYYLGAEAGSTRRWLLRLAQLLSE